MKTEAKIATIVFIVVLVYIYLMKDSSSENRNVDYESVESIQNTSSELIIDSLKLDTMEEERVKELIDSLSQN